MTGPIPAPWLAPFFLPHKAVAGLSIKTRTIALTFKLFYSYKRCCCALFCIIQLYISRIQQEGVAGDLMSILFVSETFRQMLESAEHY